MEMSGETNFCGDKGLWHEMQDKMRCEGRAQQVWAMVVARKADTEN